MKKLLTIAVVPVSALVLLLLFEMKLFPIIERLAIAEGRSFATWSSGEWTGTRDGITDPWPVV